MYVFVSSSLFSPSSSHVMLVSCLLPTLHFFKSSLLKAASSRQGDETRRCLFKYIFDRWEDNTWGICNRVYAHQRNQCPSAALAFAGCF